MKNWTADQIPDLTGKIAIVTGGNAGLGREISIQLAKKNAKVIIACRSVEKGRLAIEQIKSDLHSADLECISLDLTSMESVRTFVDAFKSQHTQLDLLINNAGVVNLKERSVTAEGFEMHMATNHLGHFALTGLLFGMLISTPHARVVTMSSGGHKYGNINFEDFNWETRPYSRVKAYGDSKLANLMFVRGLQDLFELAGADAMSVSAHPGLSATERQQSIGIGGWLTKVLAQPVWMGALPALLAATDPNVSPREYYGPKYGMRGYPKLTQMDRKVYDAQTANKLWDLSEQLTGISIEP